MTTKELGKRMLHYFRTGTCEEGDVREGLPSFVSFAESLGTTVGALRRFKEQNADFRAVWEECEEVLCERIIDGALHRRLDGAFAKFLLSARYGIGRETTEEEAFGIEISLKEPNPKKEETP